MIRVVLTTNVAGTAILKQPSSSELSLVPVFLIVTLTSVVTPVETVAGERVSCHEPAARTAVGNRIVATPTSRPAMRRAPLRSRGPRACTASGNLGRGHPETARIDKWHRSIRRRLDPLDEGRG